MTRNAALLISGTRIFTARNSAARNSAQRSDAVPPAWQTSVSGTSTPGVSTMANYDATQPGRIVLESNDLVMDYSADIARARSEHGATGVAAVPGALQAGAPQAGAPYNSTSYNSSPNAMPAVPHALALNHVSFALAAGESVAVMGPSGSGKTTLLHALAGIIRPTSGTVRFQGNDLTAMKDAERTKLRRGAFGFVFQSGQLLPELPAVENIALPLMLGGLSYEQATDRAMLWLERLGLRHLAAQRPGEMSGGQMQRIAIARALCIEPAVVFADEPTGALDQTTGREVMGILMQAAHDCGAAVIVVTHDVNVAGFCSRMVTMSDGRLSQVQPHRANRSQQAAAQPVQPMQPVQQPASAANQPASAPSRDAAPTVAQQRAMPARQAGTFANNQLPAERSTVDRPSVAGFMAMQQSAFSPLGAAASTPAFAASALSSSPIAAATGRGMWR
jgi:putative ABC transport system ATP-binding protein